MDGYFQILNGIYKSFNTLIKAEQYKEKTKENK